MIGLASICILLVVLSVLGMVGCRRLGGSSRFEPTVLATMEMKMWQAYYGKKRATLAWYLVRTLRREFGMSYGEAARIGKLLADAAMVFKRAEAGHYDVAIPPLVTAYAKLKTYTGMSFDPEDAAKAELAWWVARRTPGQNDPDTVGRGIGKLYEILYGYEHPEFMRAGHLRAEAAHLRDEGGDQCDWTRVEELLLQSYQALEKAIEDKPASTTSTAHETAATAG